MFDKLATVEARYEELTNSLGTASVQSHPAEYRKQAKMLADIEPLVEKYREYKRVAAELAQAGPLKLSGLLLGAAGGAFRPMLQFGAEPSAMVTFEIYGKPPQQLPLKIELASSADGPALLQAAPAGSGTSDPDRFIVSGTLAIDSLDPGDYVVRATVGTPEAGTALLTRTLRKVRKP